MESQETPDSWTAARMHREQREKEVTLRVLIEGASAIRVSLQLATSMDDPTKILVLTETQHRKMLQPLSFYWPVEHCLILTEEYPSADYAVDSDGVWIVTGSIPVDAELTATAL